MLITINFSVEKRTTVCCIQIKSKPLRYQAVTKKFRVAKYKLELAKPYSKFDQYFCREKDFKKDRDIDDEDDRKKKCINKMNDLIDIRSVYDSVFDHSVFDSAPKNFPDDYQTILLTKVT